jgi:hypothetical protein
MKFSRYRYLPAAISAIVLTVLSSCGAVQPTVVEKLDELTAVTITHGRTPLILSPDEPYSRANERDFLQLGAIEINRMGARKYYLWLGISDFNLMADETKYPEEFNSILLVGHGDTIRLDVYGWTAVAIGATDPVYERLFGSSIDAYYEVNLDQIRLLTDADNLKLRTTGSSPKEFGSWYKQATFRSDLSEFLQIVSQ